MDAQKEVQIDRDSRFYFARHITPQLKRFLAQRILWHYEAGKKRKKGSRFQFDLDLYRDLLLEACREAERLEVIPANTRLEVAIILGSDETFYNELVARSEKL